MADETSRHHHHLTDLLARITFILQPLHFRRTDPAATRAKVRPLTAAAHYFNILSGLLVLDPRGSDHTAE